MLLLRLFPVNPCASGGTSWNTSVFPPPVLVFKFFCSYFLVLVTLIIVYIIFFNQIISLQVLHFYTVELMKSRLNQMIDRLPSFLWQTHLWLFLFFAPRVQEVGLASLRGQGALQWISAPCTFNNYVLHEALLKIDIRIMWSVLENMRWLQSNVCICLTLVGECFCFEVCCCGGPCLRPS